MVLPSNGQICRGKGTLPLPDRSPKTRKVYFTIHWSISRQWRSRSPQCSPRICYDCKALAASNLDAAESPNSSPESAQKLYDVVALGNLCVDVVVPLDKLPPFEEVKRSELLEQLTRETVDGDQSGWEAGAQSNFMIAAGRLGMRVRSAANIGNDAYGQFLTDILKAEGVQGITPLSPSSFKKHLDQTLICFVLVDPQGRHHFCSRYDFGPWPLLPGIESLSDDVLRVLSRTKALFVNGFIFDEIPGRIVLSAVDSARKSGAATFFDPGPRAWTLHQGERKNMLNALLDLSDVVLMTQEEAEEVTGCSDAEEAAKAILDRPGAQTQWCIIKLGPHGALLRTKHPPQTLRQPAFQVPVADTVGCGDSFAAAIVLGYIQRKPLQAVLALANAVGAATATRAGAGRNVATASTVQYLLSQQALDSSNGGSADYNKWEETLSREELSSSALRDNSAGQHSQDWGLWDSSTKKSSRDALEILQESTSQQP